jgi:tetratricopeptide (TPR) repeat protein
MRWCLDRWRGCAALLMVLCALVSPACAADDVGKKDGSTKPEKKNPLIEDAGKALLEGKVDDAYKLLKDAVAKDSELPPARLMLARLMIASQVREYQGRIRGVVELAISENNDHPVCYLDNSDLALAENRITDAILNAEKALALSAAARWNPTQKKDTETKAHNIMAASYEARQNWESARTQLTALLAKDEKNGQIRARLARALFMLEKPQPEEAYAELQKAVKDDAERKREAGQPEMDPANVAMARLWNQKGEVDKAREYFDKAIKSDPGKTRVHIAYADWLMQQNKIEEAKLHIAEAAKIKADDPEVMKFQGLIYRVQKNYAEAEKILKQILNLSPNDTFARNHLALVLIDQPGEANHKLAKDHAELNASANPKSPEALATLGYVYCKLKNTDDALKMLQASVNASNGQITPDTGYYLALCLQEKNQIDKAVEVIKAAILGKGLFVYKTETEDLRNKLEAKQKQASSR